MEILLDTNFILACAKQKVDFVSWAEDNLGEVSWVVPDLVLAELEELSKRKGEKGKDKEAANLGLQLLGRVKFQKIVLKGKDTDLAIRQFIEGKDIALATLDKGLKNKVKNKILTIKDVKGLEIILS